MPTGAHKRTADPGNADSVITVGATHRYMPHTYGVSYFSSKGPTGDGRIKPDLVAPGERITSCAAGEVLHDKLFADVPPGWRVVFGGADRAACLDYVEQNWPDIRPKTLRDTLRSSL